MSRVAWSQTMIAVGVACGVGILLSPAVLGSAGTDVIIAAGLPLSFLAAGGVAQVLRAGHLVGHRLLVVAVSHLSAIVCAVTVVLLANRPEVALAISWVSAILFALGFVALLDLLARYPTGDHAWPLVRRVVQAAVFVALALTTLSVLGSRLMPSLLNLDAGANPLHLPALEGLTPAVSAIALFPVLGLGLLLARYRSASTLDRAQMRWPIVAALVVAAGLVSTSLVETTLGATVQAALFVIAAAALPASFLVGLLRHTEQAERLAALEGSRARLAEVADSERRRIERDLHDGAQQQLLALLATVELARAKLGDGDGEVDDTLRDISEGIRQVHRDLRELAQGIHPAVLTDCGLGEAVRSALVRLPLRTQLVVDPQVDRKRYPQTVEGAAYFLVLEGLANAMKHAETTTARVHLSSRDDVLEVTVSDSGRGFPAPGEGAPNSGLIGLRDRVAAVGGRLELDSSPGLGTTLRATFPAYGHAAS